MTIKGVTFDLGSTLIEFRGDWGDIFRSLSADLITYLRDHNFNLDFEKFEQRYQEIVAQFYTRGQQDWIEYTAEYTLRYTLAEFGYPDVSEKVLKKGLAAAFAQGELLWRPFGDVYRTLDVLKVRGYRIGLISNARDAANVERLIDNAQLRPWLDPIVISANVGVRKPNPHIFQLVLDAWQLPPEQVVMVGDMLGADILGAHNAGLRAVWATMQTEREANTAHMQTIVPDAAIASLSELPPLLEKWENEAG
ncbi:Pyrimidine 5'-nucleotidase YjjG [Thermoflexales bacterium]|nr:Pyrimidine 5'-nucleotidase YjjG [Thermoflexales bacterium]